MSNFIKFGMGVNETRLNKQDVVSIKKVSSSRVEITYRTIDPTGKNPYIIAQELIGMPDAEYENLIKIIDED
ncbi:hypothetical protein [Bacteroides nordii]|uniref:Uncharacterized protein n=1 Tax=Bacteroides nordii CL02T12C05 TaxID=997884 RepID=I9SCX9_9BACE|nr:hypothetical protein [Bacteroides nordii]EIY53731.1 hypothetical protein HMPREF1068_00901 [Bacteroides nordii CL02T12C05]MCG4769981.1 hypothetical protein [Bacteroides nordii]